MTQNPFHKDTLDNAHAEENLSLYFIKTKKSKNLKFKKNTWFRIWNALLLNFWIPTDKLFLGYIVLHLKKSSRQLKDKFLDYKSPVLALSCHWLLRFIRKKTQ